ncbi:MAG: AmmeMemoRadiSam system protein B [bacterium]|nr:AmmeMemoRadiSam system protein B [bacterium]
MITFAAIAPHSPLLLPTIGKEHQKKLKKTLVAYKTLEEDLYASKTDTLLVLSPHGTILKNAFSLSIAPSYKTNFKEFGDFVTAFTLPTDAHTIEAIRRLRHDRQDPAPIVGITEEFLDYGVAVPLFFLSQHLPALRIVPIGVSHLSLGKHFLVGKNIGKVVQRSTARIGIIASADLAHTLTDAAPGGFSLKGKEFDAKFVQALRRDDRAGILKLEETMDDAKACGLRTIAMLFGMIENMNCAAELLSYEGPFGIGYLTARFNFR